MRTSNYVSLTGAVVGVTLFAAASQVATAAPVLNPENGHYYDYIKTTMTWSAARTDAARCSGEGGDCAVAAGDDEQPGWRDIGTHPV